MKMKFIIAVVVMVAILAALLGGTAYYTYSEYTEASVDIETSPELIFDETCIAPGDVFSKTVTVYNRGTLDYDYNISCSQSEGDATLYNFLELEIKRADGSIFYAGLLGELQKQSMGSLAAGYDENYQFTIRFPDKANNSFQLQSTGVNFIFNAVEHHPVPCGQVAFEHPIINNQFVLLQGSSLPIKFHLIDCKTGQYETTPRDGITLEIIGPNALGVQTVYKFSMNDPVDILKWDENLTEPHYCAVFSTKTYPVMPEGHYRAQVKDNGTLMGYIDFTANVESEANRSNSTVYK